MIAVLDGPIELRITLGLENRIAVKGGGEIEQPAWAHQGTEPRQCRWHVYQVEKALLDQQVPLPAAVLADNETRHVDRFGFYRDVLPSLANMQLSVAAVVYLKPPLTSAMGEAALGFGDQCGRFINGSVGRMGQHITSQEPLHHAADAGSHLE